MISVIIPAYQAHLTLPSVLRALEPQVSGEDREVVLVDSTSAANAERLERAWPWIRVVSPGERTLPGRARNLGAAIARGDVLAFLDADTIPAPGWLDALQRGLVPPVEMVAGAILNGTPQSPWGTAGYMLEFLEWVPARSSPIRHAASCNLLVRRDAFQAAGGFAEDLWPGEDTVFTVPFALNGTLAFAPGAQVQHLNRTDRRAVLDHQRRLGASWVSVSRRVSVRGGWLAARWLAPLAVLARVYSVVRQLCREPSAARRLARHGPRLAAGLVAWGSGFFGSHGGQPAPHEKTDEPGGR
jgi:GT2 family glycosyltransferase